MNKWIYIAYACAWIATGIAVVAGIYLTQNANCLWAMLIPAFIEVSSSKK